MFSGSIHELLHVGLHSRVVRAVDIRRGHDVALKLARDDAASDRASSRLEHEYEMLCEAQVPGVVRVLGLEPIGEARALVLEYWGMSLDRILAQGRLPVGVVLRLGAMLARILGRVHRRGIIHCDIKPHNVLCDAERSELRLIDFSVSVRRRVYVGEQSAPEKLAGTLAYMAPEQTGRMNRGVDARSDLYSLGVTLYEMLTGVLPFDTTDMLDLVHAHIALKPKAPSDRASSSGISTLIDSIIMKLLEKNPDDRYQTAEGVAFDLDEAAQALEKGGAAGPFVVAARDWPNRLRKPSRLFGRDDALMGLKVAFGRAAAGESGVVLVTGPSGVGKSAVVQALREHVQKAGAMFASGKFDQLQRSAPYSAISGALGSFVRRRLAGSSDELAGWKRAWEKAAGPNGRILIDLVPELTHILDKPLELPEVGPIEAKNRFRHTVSSFVRTMATSAHPLVLFIDDLQWSDPSSLALLHDLVTSPESSHLMVVGTYRDNEVDERHSVTLWKESISRSGHGVMTLQLEPLGGRALEEMVADILDRPVQEIAPLAALTKDKADGSPFFVEQFLSLLREEGILWRDSDTGGWHWDAERMQRLGVADNVAHLLARKLGELHAPVQRLFAVAACIGIQFRVQVLDCVLGWAAADLRAGIDEGVHGGLLLPVGDVAGEVYEFIHDRVQRTAYESLGIEEREAIHYDIAIAIQKLAGDELGDADLDGVLHHYLRSLGRAVTLGEKLHIAQLCLRGGRRAKAGAAYAEACDMLRAALTLLGSQRWEVARELSFDLQLALGEMSWLADDCTLGQTMLQECMHYATSRLERIRVAIVWMTLLALKVRHAEALDLGLTILDECGWQLPRNAESIQPFVRAQLARIVPRLMAIVPEELSNWKSCTDVETEMVGLLLARVATLAVVGKSELLPAVGFAMVDHSLVHGVSRVTSAACGGGAVMSVLFLQNLELAARLLQLSRAFLHRATGAKAYAINTSKLAQQYIDPLGEIIDEWQSGVDIGRQEGDLSLSERCSFVPYLTRVISGRALEPPCEYRTARDEGGRTLGIVHEALFLAFTSTSASAARALVRECVEAIPVKPVARHWAYSSAAYFALHMGDDSVCLDDAFIAEPHWHASSAGPNLIAMVFALCLSGVRQIPSSSELRSRLDFHRARLNAWAAFTPKNFLHMKLLVDACAAWALGTHDDAERLFDEAIDCAHQDGFLNDEALGFRLAGEFELERGRIHRARAHLLAACDGYERWGALACAQALREKHARFFPIRSSVHDGTHSPSVPVIAKRSATSTLTTTSDPGLDNQLDAVALVRASQVLLWDIHLNSLVGRMLRLLVAQGGATRAVLVLLRDDELRVHAELSTDPERIDVELDELLHSSSRVPYALVQLAVRGKQTVVAGRNDEESFDEDPYLKTHRPASVLVVPLVHQGRISGVVYLEHASVIGAFSEARGQVISLLASHAAVAVENALWYRDLENKVAARTAELREKNEQLEKEMFARAALEAERERMSAERNALQERIIESQKARIVELSPKLIPITDRVMVMPLIGTMDRERANDATDAMLFGANRTQSEFIIIDVTGVHSFEQGSVQMLARASNGLNLLGTNTVVTGIHSTIARTLVNTQVYLDGMVVKSTLQEGVRYAMHASASRARR